MRCELNIMRGTVPFARLERGQTFISAYSKSIYIKTDEPGRNACQVSGVGGMLSTFAPNDPVIPINGKFVED